MMLIDLNNQRFFIWDLFTLCRKTYTGHFHEKTGDKYHQVYQSQKCY